jgi:hypothetical protein
MKQLKEAINNLNQIMSELEKLNETFDSVFSSGDRYVEREEGTKVRSKPSKVRRIVDNDRSPYLSEEESRDTFLAVKALERRFGQKNLAESLKVSPLAIARIKTGRNRKCRRAFADKVKHLFEEVM